MGKYPPTRCMGNLNHWMLDGLCRTPVTWQRVRECICPCNQWYPVSTYMYFQQHQYTALLFFLGSYPLMNKFPWMQYSDQPCKLHIDSGAMFCWTTFLCTRLFAWLHNLCVNLFWLDGLVVIADIEKHEWLHKQKMQCLSMQKKHISYIGHFESTFSLMWSIFF